LVIPPIAQQTLKFIDTVPELVRTVSEQWSGIGELVARYHVQPQVDQAVAALKDNSIGWATSAGKNFLSGIGSAMAMFAATILVLVMTFLMLVEGPLWMSRIWNAYTDTDKMKYHRSLVRRMGGVVSGYATGQLTVSGLGGVFAGLAVFIIHLFFPAVPANLALPTVAIAFTLSLIPMFGATIAGIIVSILLLVNSIPAGIIFAVYFMIYQQLENNFISPTIQAKRIELSPLAVLVAVTIGLYMFGIAGGIISIPVAGCLKVLVEDYFARTRTVRKHNEQPMTKLINKIKGEEA
jgi:predicted PurR-regulated permease PerM